MVEAKKRRKLGKRTTENKYHMKKGAMPILAIRLSVISKEDEQTKAIRIKKDEIDCTKK